MSVALPSIEPVLPGRLPGIEVVRPQHAVVIDQSAFDQCGDHRPVAIHERRDLVGAVLSAALEIPRADRARHRFDVVGRRGHAGDASTIGRMP